MNEEKENAELQMKKYSDLQNQWTAYSKRLVEEYGVIYAAGIQHNIGICRELRPDRKYYDLSTHQKDQVGIEEIKKGAAITSQLKQLEKENPKIACAYHSEKKTVIEYFYLHCHVLQPSLIIHCNKKETLYFSEVMVESISPYFSCVFESLHQEQKENKEQIVWELKDEEIYNLLRMFKLGFDSYQNGPRIETPSLTTIFYFDDSELTLDNTLQILSTSHRIDAQKVEKRCEKFLIEHFTRFSMNTLKESATKYHLQILGRRINELVPKEEQINLKFINLRYE